MSTIVQKIARAGLLGASIAATAAPQLAFAQAGAGPVTFELQWTFQADRIEPNPRNGVMTQFRVAVELSGRNRVSGGVVRDAVRRQAQDVRVREGQLGGNWRVVDASTIQGTRELPQSFNIVTITTSGSTCSARVEYRLKPGFQDYKFPMVGTRQMGTFRNVHVGHVSCAVRAS